MAAAASPERPLGQAHSETWLAAQKNVVRIFDDKFRASSPRRQAAYPTPWLGMSESQVINPTMYEDFLKYLVDEYVVEAGRSRGERLAAHSVMNYLGCLLRRSCSCWATSPARRTRPSWASAAPSPPSCLTSSRPTSRASSWRATAGARARP